ncbi:hypothetical protein [Tropicibacter sp. S64]|uniref:hypothetical protein n=1 Tax=Tropicibacter sp. S64 TaxID=3415122 RepID=UPI003C7EBE90
MTHHTLPLAPIDVLDIPEQEISEVIRALIGHRQLTPLMRRINADLHSGNRTLRQQSRSALQRLGFPE